MIRSGHGIVVGIAALMACAGAAHAGDGAADMTLGVEAPPPPGFIALCETSPQDCAAPLASPSDLAEVRMWAGRTRWTLAFQAAGLILPTPNAMPAAPPGAIGPKPTVDRSSIRAAKDAARKAAARPRTKVKPRSEPSQAEPAPAPAPPPALERPAPPSLRALQAVNTRVNRAIRRSTDLDAFGQPDVWAAPTGPRPIGDCEDYVLAKRRALLETGVDPAHLSIALVRTRSGEAHAVLLVATDDGERVLDNLSPWVLRWDEAPYEWLERQAPGEPLRWVRPASGR